VSAGDQEECSIWPVRSSVAVLRTARSPRCADQNTDTARKSRHPYTYVLKVCQTGASDTAEGKECNVELYSLTEALAGHQLCY